VALLGGKAPGLCAQARPDEPLLIHALSRSAVLLGPTAIMLGQGHGQLGDRLDETSAFALRLVSADLLHQAVHVPQLLQGRPAAVLAAPAGSRGQPDGEGLRKIVVRVLLCVRVPVGAATEVTNEFPAPRIRAKNVPIGLREGTEGVPPARLLPQPEGIVDRMAGFVSQQLHDRLAVFYVAGLLALNAPERSAGQVEGYTDGRHPVRAAPGIGQVEGRHEVHALGRQLPLQLPGERLDGRSLDSKPKVTDASSQQSVPNGLPIAGPGPRPVRYTLSCAPFRSHPLSSHLYHKPRAMLRGDPKLIKCLLRQVSQHLIICYLIREGDCKAICGWV
jgi:hypothetical protein